MKLRINDVVAVKGCPDAGKGVVEGLFQKWEGTQLLVRFAITDAKQVKLLQLHSLQCLTPNGQCSRLYAFEESELMPETGEAHEHRQKRQTVTGTAAKTKT